MGVVSSSSCVFCEIMAGRAEASMPYQDDLVVVIMDINPVAPGDALVIPRVHAVGLHDLDEETGVHMWRIGHRLAGALRRSGLRCEGVNFSSLMARRRSSRSSMCICMCFRVTTGTGSGCTWPRAPESAVC